MWVILARTRKCCLRRVRQINSSACAMPAEEFASFIGFHYSKLDLALLGTQKKRPESLPSECETHDVCAILSWTRQVQRIAARVAARTQSRTSVHLFTRCISSEQGKSFGAAREHALRPQVVVHQEHDPRLTELLHRIRLWAISAPHSRPPPKQWTSIFLLNLLRWTVVRCTWAKLVISLDIDTDPFPLLDRSSAISERNANWASDWSDHWVALLRCAASEQNFSLFSLPDGSAPVNTGFLIIKPDAALYEEGLSVLRRAANTFNSTHGWDAIGPPSRSIPRSDFARRLVEQRLGSLEMITRDNWEFASAESDQGFFFYVYRLRHRLGADLRVLPNCRRSAIHAGRVHRTRRAHATLGHYCGGLKPEVLLNMQLCRFESWPAFLKHVCPVCKRNMSDRPERSAWEVARSVGWGRRTLLELARLQRTLGRGFNPSKQPENVVVGNNADAEDWPKRCDAWLHSTLSCTDDALARWRVVVSDRIRRMVKRSRRVALATSATEMSADDFIRAKWKHLDDARPHHPAIS